MFQLRGRAQKRLDEKATDALLAHLWVPARWRNSCLFWQQCFHYIILLQERTCAPWPFVVICTDFMQYWNGFADIYCSHRARTTIDFQHVRVSRCLQHTTTRLRLIWGALFGLPYERCMGCRDAVCHTFRVHMLTICTDTTSEDTKVCTILTQMFVLTNAWWVFDTRMTPWQIV